MNPSEFDAVWTLLSGAYPRAYPAGSKEVWARRLAGLDGSLLFQVTGDLIDQNTKPLTVAAVLGEYFNRKREQDRRSDNAAYRPDPLAVSNQRRRAYIAANKAVLVGAYQKPPEDMQGDSEWDAWLSRFSDAPEQAFL